MRLVDNKDFLQKKKREGFQMARDVLLFLGLGPTAMDLERLDEPRIASVDDIACIDYLLQARDRQCKVAE